MTFPSSGASDQGMGVQLRSLENGVYDRSKTRTNDLEAQAVVDEVLTRLTAEGPPEEKDTIGVVAFSRAQQTKIEDLLDIARRDHPQIECHFQDGTREPVFVKNLENVQGDERDIILFSICYGPDEDGKVSMNFGPLNREGGERRLNVAITRARKQLVVFSTLRPEHIDLSRSRALGVSHLKSFLDYAQRGPIALPTNVTEAAEREFKSPLVDAIAEALQLAGYETSTHVGTSGHPIDVAIHDPEQEGKYLLGIECDGTNYRNAATARDRDRLRPAVLQGLGWKLYRVWSGDWLEDPERELERILSHMGTANKQTTQEATPRHSEPETSMETDFEDSPATSDEEEGEELFLKLVEKVEIYRPSVVEEMAGGPTALYDERLAGQIQTRIKTILSVEAPISLSLLCRRLMARFDIDRLTNKVKERVRVLVDNLPSAERPDEFDSVFFQKGTSPDTYRIFRTAALGEIPRQADDIHPIEVANAARRVLKEQIALPMADLPKETARMLGFPRLGSRVRAAMKKGIEEMVGRGWAIVDNDYVRLPRSYPDLDDQ